MGKHVKVQDTGWQVIGEVGIDSGCLVLVDPAYTAYVEGFWERPNLDATLYRVMSPHAVNVQLGVVVPTGMGDGVYPVEGRFENVDGGQRLAEIRIRFLPHPVIGYDLATIAEGDEA
jgi:hypothetical protein